MAPRPHRRPSQLVIDELKRLNVTYIDSVTNTDTSGYGTVNRIVAGSFIEATTTHELIVVVDSDTLVLAPLDALILGAEVDMRARAVDLLGLSATGAEHPMAPYWTEVCRLAEITLDELPLTTTTVDRSPIVANYNGGLVVVRRSVGILQRLEKLYVQIVAAGLRPRSHAHGFRAGAGFVPPKWPRFSVRHKPLCRSRRGASPVELRSCHLRKKCRCTSLRRCCQPRAPHRSPGQHMCTITGCSTRISRSILCAASSIAR